MKKSLNPKIQVIIMIQLENMNLIQMMEQRKQINDSIIWNFNAIYRQSFSFSVSFSASGSRVVFMLTHFSSTTHDRN